MGTEVSETCLLQNRKGFTWMEMSMVQSEEGGGEGVKDKLSSVTYIMGHAHKTHSSQQT